MDDILEDPSLLRNLNQKLQSGGKTLNFTIKILRKIVSNHVASQELAISELGILDSIQEKVKDAKQGKLDDQNF